MQHDCILIGSTSMNTWEIYDRVSSTSETNISSIFLHFLPFHHLDLYWFDWFLLDFIKVFQFLFSRKTALIKFHLFFLLGILRPLQCTVGPIKALFHLQKCHTQCITHSPELRFKCLLVVLFLSQIVLFVFFYHVPLFICCIYHSYCINMAFLVIIIMILHISWCCSHQ